MRGTLSHQVDAEEESRLEVLRGLVHKTPALVHFGYEMLALERGTAVIGFMPKKDHVNGGGCVHGGILSTLLDTSGWFAAASCSRGRWLSLFTTEQTTTYVDAVALEPVRSTARCFKVSASLFRTDAELTSRGGRLIAKALMTYYLLPARSAL